MGNTLVVTNDFPPRSGAIQSFVHALTARQTTGTVTVYEADWEGAAEFDSRQPFPLIRQPGQSIMGPARAARSFCSCHASMPTTVSRRAYRFQICNPDSDPACRQRY